MTEPTALELATTDELAEELFRRFDDVIVVVHRKHPDTAGSTDCYWSGPHYECAGLCDLAKLQIFSHALRDEDDDDDGE